VSPYPAMNAAAVPDVTAVVVQRVEMKCDGDKLLKLETERALRAAIAAEADSIRVLFLGVRGNVNQVRAFETVGGHLYYPEQWNEPSWAWTADRRYVMVGNRVWIPTTFASDTTYSCFPAGVPDKTHRSDNATFLQILQQKCPSSVLVVRHSQRFPAVSPDGWVIG